MSFVDLRFLFFFPAVVIGHFLLPRKFRWILLLVASYVFYMAWKPEYSLLLAAITLIDFCAGYLIGTRTETTFRKRILYVSLAANLGILFFFKYFNFFFDTISGALHSIGVGASFPVLDIILPIGISFHIFQSISYTIDVYKGKAKHVTHLGKFALYVSFFPQLVAGPIERPNGLLVQFFEDRGFDRTKAVAGVKLMLMGFFKKIVIADHLAPLVNAVYASPADFTGPSIIIATVLFAYQLYCDFSGYTDIARGSAMILGYDLALNFNRPYNSATVAEFWRKWHISLSSWLRDYLYTPLALGGKHHSAQRAYISIFVTFVLIGLWHGANWTYIIMGAIHGIYLISGSITSRWAIRRKFSLPKPLKIITVFALVSFTWIFFRAKSTTDAIYIVEHLFSGVGHFFSQLFTLNGFASTVLMGTPFSSFIIGFLGIFVLEGYETLSRKNIALLPSKSRPLRLAALGVLVVLIILLGAFSLPEQFIYFQF